MSLDRDPRLPVIPNRAHIGPEVAQHPFCMIARRLPLDDGRFPRGSEAGDQNGALDLCRGHRQHVLDRHQVACAADRQRQRLLVLHHLESHLLQRIQHPAHRPAGKRGIADQLHGDGMAGDDTHDKARASARVAEVKRTRRLAQSPNSTAQHFPARAGLARRGAHRRNRRGRIDHILGFEQASDRRPAGCQRAKQQRAVGDRLVAGNPAIAAERTCRQRGKRTRSRDCHRCDPAIMRGRSERQPGGSGKRGGR